MTDHDDTSAHRANGAARRIAGARDRAKASAAQLRGRAGEAGASGREWALDTAGLLRGVVHDRPLATAGVSAASAFVAGLALGLIIARAFDEPARQWRRIRVGKEHRPHWRDY